MYGMDAIGLWRWAQTRPEGCMQPCLEYQVLANEGTESDRSSSYTVWGVFEQNQ